MPAFNPPRDLQVSEGPYQTDLGCYTVELVPILLGAIEVRINEWAWVDADNWCRGRQLLREYQVNLLMGCTELVEAQNRLYRLLDSTFNGVTYTVTGTDPVTGKNLVSPDIPDVPAPLVPERAPIRIALDELPGLIDMGWFGLGGRKATIADLLAALRVGNSQTATDLADKVREFLVGTGSAVSIADFIEDLLNNTASTAAEGGLLAVVMGASLAQGAMMGAQAAQLDRIIKSLDGGGLTGPDDSVLKALRGDELARADRNVIDTAKNQELRDRLDLLIAEAQKINDSDADLADLLAKIEEVRALLV